MLAVTGAIVASHTDAAMPTSVCRAVVRVIRCELVPILALCLHTIPVLQRRNDGPLWIGFSSAYSVVGSLIGHFASSIFGPLQKGFNLSESCDAHVTSSISILSLIRDEFAVSRFIAFVDVLSLNRQSTTISMTDSPLLKHWKTVKPLITDCDTAASVPLVGFIGFGVAPFLHARPNTVQRLNVVDFFHEHLRSAIRFCIRGNQSRNDRCSELVMSRSLSPLNILTQGAV